MKRFWLVLTALVLCLSTATTSQARPTSPYHLVHRGETLTSIARLYAPNPVQELRDANGIVGDRIYAGEYLRLPDSWFTSSVSTSAPTPTPIKKDGGMNYLLTQILLWAVLIIMAIATLVLMLRGIGVLRTVPAPPPSPAPCDRHHCSCGGHHYYRSTVVPVAMTVAPITIDPVHVNVHHGFPADGIPVTITKDAPTAATTS